MKIQQLILVTILAGVFTIGCASSGDSMDEATDGASDKMEGMKDSASDKMEGMKDDAEGKVKDKASY